MPQKLEFQGPPQVGIFVYGACKEAPPGRHMAPAWLTPPDTIDPFDPFDPPPMTYPPPYNLIEFNLI